MSAKEYPSTWASGSTDSYGLQWEFWLEFGNVGISILVSHYHINPIVEKGLYADDWHWGIFFDLPDRGLFGEGNANTILRKEFG